MAASKSPAGNAMPPGTDAPCTTHRQLTEAWAGGVKLLVPVGKAMGASRVPVKGTRCSVPLPAAAWVLMEMMPLAGWIVMDATLRVAAGDG